MPDFQKYINFGRHWGLSLIHISEPTRQEAISYAVFCLKKKSAFLTVIVADASVMQLVKALPPNLSVFCCHEFNSGLRQAGVPDFQKYINFGRHWGNNP